MWIRVETNVADNDKIHCFGNFLGTSTEEALGFLVRTWGKIAEHRTDGNLEGVLDMTIEVWANWRGEPGVYAKGFREHFVSGCHVVGWEERQGKLIARLTQDRERKRSVEIPRKVRGKSTPTIRDDTKKELETIFNDQFWSAYPRRTGGEGKTPAQVAFVALVLKEKLDPTFLVSKAGEYRKFCEAEKTEGKYILMATTWLKTKRGWEEEYLTTKKSKKQPLITDIIAQQKAEGRW